LSAYPKLSKEMPDPFDLNLNIQLNTETAPEILSNYEASLSINNLKGDLDTFFKTQSPELLDCLCSKLMQSIEKIGGRELPSNAVINAVILYCLKHLNTDEYPFEVVFERIMLKLDDVTRVCFINAAVNELRYPNSHTLQVCLALVNIYKRID
jgi:CCR4-NOT transcription complex subunit 1